VYQGKYGKVSGSGLNFTIKSFGDTGIVDFLQDAVVWLKDIEKNSKITSKDTDLLNIRDELIGQINQTLYLFTFK
jgi:hypothetical protein